MTTTSSQTNPPRGGRWWQWLAWGAGGLVALVVVLYFVATSSAFFQAVILPRIGQALNAEVSVGGAAISPFSHVVLRDVKIKPRGAEPVFTAASISARYSLLAILRGHILVDEAAVEAPTVTIIEQANGARNVDPLLKAVAPTAAPAPRKTAPQPRAAAPPSAPPAVEIKSVRLEQATIRYVKHRPDGGQETIVLTPLTIKASDIQNGATGKLEVAATVALDETARATAPATSLQANLRGTFTCQLTPDLHPGAVQGTAAVSVDKATGEFAEFAALAAALDCEVTSTDVKQLALRFTKAGATLGEIRLSGPFDLAKTEGKLKIEVSALDRQVLNVFGAAAGIDFGTTTVNASTELGLTKGGAVITAAGTVQVARFQVTRQQQTTPTLDLRADYNVTVARAAQSARLQALTLVATQDQRPLLQAELTSPMTVAWGGTSNDVGDAALNLTVTDLNLADWQAFAAGAAPAGVANLKLNLLSQQGGRQLAFDVDGRVAQFAARIGQNQAGPVDVHLVARGSGVDEQQFNITAGRLELAQQGQSVLAVSCAGRFDRAGREIDLQVSLQAALDRLAALLAQPTFTCSAGKLDLTGRVTGQQQTQAVTGQLTLADFTGRYGDYRLDNFGLTTALDVARRGKQLEIRKATGQLRQGPTAGGRFDASGTYDLARQTGQMSVKLAGFTQNDLGPFLAPSLGEKKLVSVSLNTTASAGFSVQGAATVNADVEVANLVVQDPQGNLPATPLAARLQIDLAASNKVATVHQGQLTLTPTPRAKNELRLSGTVDYTKTSAITGSLKVTADSLDATAYYDLFAGAKKTGGNTGATEAKASSEPAAAAVPAATEPAAVTLPVRNFTADLAVGHFYLREVDVANLQVTAKLDGGHVVLQPCQLTLNGAPVNATVDLDLGVPGYKYEVVFGANKVPLLPLVDSFSPTYRDKAQGDLVANVQVKGAGLTGTSLREHLTGQVTLCLTNANIQIVGPKVKKILSPIALVLGAPELLNSPLDYLSANLQFAGGKIEIRQFVAHSVAFLAESQGTIPIADVLTDSPLNQPVDISLAQELANKLRLTSGSAAAGYTKLPTFVRLTGTLGDPGAKTDKAVIVGLTAGGIAGAVGGTAGGLLQGISGILTGQSGPTTNAPPRSSGQKLNPFDLLKGLTR